MLLSNIDRYYLHSFLTTDEHNTNVYGMRFINPDKIVLDIAFGQLESKMYNKLRKDNFVIVRDHHNYFKKICDSNQECIISIGRTHFESDVELCIRMPKGVIEVPYTVTGNSMAVAENDDVQVINWPNYTVRYKKGCKHADRRFGDKSSELLDAVTNFVYRTGLVEDLCGFSAQVVSVNKHVRVTICSYMDESNLTQDFAEEVIRYNMKNFVGEDVWGTGFGNSIIEKIEIRGEVEGSYLGVPNVAIDISEKLVEAMNMKTRKDYLKFKGEHYVGSLFDGVVFKNGMITSYINSGRCKGVETSGYKVKATKVSMNIDTSRVTPGTQAVSFDAFFKTDDRVVAGFIFFYNYHLRFDGYRSGKNVLDNVFAQCHDYLDEYGTLLSLEPAVKLENTFCYIYYKYNIKENVNGSVISQRHEMFKYVLEEAFDKVKNSEIAKDMKPKVIRRGENILVGLQVFETPTIFGVDW